MDLYVSRIILFTCTNICKLVFVYMFIFFHEYHKLVFGVGEFYLKFFMHNYIFCTFIRIILLQMLSAYFVLLGGVLQMKLTDLRYFFKPY